MVADANVVEVALVVVRSRLQNRITTWGQTPRQRANHVLLTLALTLLLCLFTVSCGDDGSAVLVGDEAGETSLAELEAEAIALLVSVDNSFGSGADPFEIVNIGTLIGGDADRPIDPRAHDLIETALEGSAEIVFVSDIEASIDELFEQNTAGVAVANIEDVRIDGESAELDMRLWCGSLCGVFLTYEAELRNTGWEIVGTTGPIAIS